ncbi:MAG: argininosuccinate lyase [Candidatus Omnitrophica bacterium]|nr:argininosuccinate lyase [Candidatus Omnitrophota bacterium]
MKRSSKRPVASSQGNKVSSPPRRPRGAVGPSAQPALEQTARKRGSSRDVAPAEAGAYFEIPSSEGMTSMSDSRVRGNDRGREALWGSRFKEGLDSEAKAFSYSLAVDGELFGAEIKVNVAYASMLTKCGLISKKEGEQIVRGLEAVEAEFKSSDFYELTGPYEDVHTLIQSELEKRVGPVAKKLHMGRSRNDLVATSTRVYVKERISQVLEQLESFQRELLNVAGKNSKTLFPGYTHLQRAQVVSFAHHLLAYVEMLERDRGRFQDAGDRMDELVLGSAALAGTSIPIDREFLQKMLRFQRIAQNSMDAVSDRDFVLETLSALAILFVHLSRFAEDLILWTGSEFGYITVADRYSTGSSLMPHKKNPDMLELVRGKTGTVYGSLLSVLVTMKGIPLTYNRDMQEDKKPLFSALREAVSSLGILSSVVKSMKINQEAMRNALKDDRLYATDLAEYLVLKGVPFKDAHRAVGELVLVAEKKGKSLRELSLEDFRSANPKFGSDVKQLFSPERSVNAKKSKGSTSAESVKEQIAFWRKRFRAHS